MFSVEVTGWGPPSDVNVGLSVSLLANLLHNYGQSPFLMGKSTISMAIFNSYVSLPEGTP